MISAGILPTIPVRIQARGVHELTSPVDFIDIGMNFLNSVDAVKFGR